MSLATGSAKLQHALKTIKSRWEEIQSGWDDGVRREFEERYWLPLEPGVLSAVRAIERLSRVLDQARRECS
jgi:hypothetical protein